jgi:tight adherence protein C
MTRDRGPAEGLLIGDDTGSAGVRRPVTRLLDRLAMRMGPRLVRELSDVRRTRLRNMLDRAGRPGGLSVEEYLGRQAAYAALAVLIGLLLVLAGAALAALLVIFLGLIFPWIMISRAGRVRQERIARDLPDFLDVLSVTVRAGLTYRVSLARVAQALGGPMGEEVTMTLRQMDLGATRREAFLGLSERNDADSLRSYVAAQLQAEELGVPLADALGEIAQDVRRESHQDARRRAQRAAPRVSLIVTTFIVPASVLLIMVALFLSSGVREGGLFG